MASFFVCRNYRMLLGGKSRVMGILNVTPDSFSDGGLYHSPEKALTHALQMQAMGADIIDIGAESTRPGADILSEKEELERLQQYLPLLQRNLSVPLSIDTFYPGCAEYALKHGVSIINDISGKVQKDMGILAGRYGAGLIVVHNPGGIHGASARIDTPDLLTDVRCFFIHCQQEYRRMGVSPDSICYDPGIGFGKNQEQNLELIRYLQDLKPHPASCVLCGASRKRFIGSICRENQATERDPGTVAAHTLAIAGGADIIRVHNVHAGIQTVRMADAICRANVCRNPEI